MKYFTKETKLTDGSKVYDFQMYPNGEDFLGRKKIIISCDSELSLYRFVHEFKALIHRYTIETLEDG